MKPDRVKIGSERELAQIYLLQDLPEGHPLAPLHQRLRESQGYRNAVDRRFVVIAIRDGVYEGKALTVEHFMTANPLMLATTMLATDRNELVAARRAFHIMVKRLISGKKNRGRIPIDTERF